MQNMLVGKKITLTLALSLTLILTSTLGFADHPLITEEAETVGKGAFEIELNGEYEVEKEEGERRRAFEIESEITYGLLDNLDLALNFPFQFVRTKEEEEEGWETSRERGFGDIGLALKWVFYEKKKFSAALKPGITLPTGDEKKELGQGKVTYGLGLIATQEIGSWEFHGNLSYVRNENKLDERKDLWRASLAAVFEVVKDLQLVGDIGIERNPDKESNRDPVFLIGGIIYSVTKNVYVDFGVKYMLNKPDGASEYALLSGIVFTF